MHHVRHEIPNTQVSAAGVQVSSDADHVRAHNECG